MALETTLREPIHLTDPLTAEPPQPVRGCDMCESRFGQWQEASDPRSSAYDPSHATDLAVEIKCHPHEWKKTAR